MNDYKLNYARTRLSKVCDVLRQSRTFSSHRVGYWDGDRVRTSWLYSTDYPEYDDENGEGLYALLCCEWRVFPKLIKAMAFTIPCASPPREAGSAGRWVIMVVPRVPGDVEIMRQDAIAQGRCRTLIVMGEGETAVVFACEWMEDDEKAKFELFDILADALRAACTKIEYSGDRDQGWPDITNVVIKQGERLVADYDYLKDLMHRALDLKGEAWVAYFEQEAAKLLAP